MQKISSLVFLLSTACLAAYSTAVVALAIPSGPRQCGMGEVGTALADDENTVYWNPAGLSVPNSRWHGGAAGQFYERLFAQLGVQDIWHLHFSGCYQPPGRSVGFGLDLKTVSFGEDALASEEGAEIAKFRSSEGVYSAAWGFNFQKLGLKNHFFGVAVKHVYSALAPMPNTPKCVGSSIAVDVGYLYTFLDVLRLGVTLTNMGPAISYRDPREANSLPFRINLAIGCKKQFKLKSATAIGVNAEYRLSREFAAYDPKTDYPYPFWKAIGKDWGDATFSANWREINHSIGAEVVLCNVVSLRTGCLINIPGQQFEQHYGIGLRLFNHFDGDLYWISSPQGRMQNFFTAGGTSGLRDRQVGFNLISSFFRIGRWEKNDRTWWKTSQ